MENKTAITLALFDVILAILILIFAILLFVHFNTSHYEEVGEIGYNWQDTPINRFSFGSCDDETRINILKGNKWQGTSSGCDCNGYYDRGYCSKSKKSKSYYSRCMNINPLSPREFITWRNTRICKEKQSFSYLNTTTYENSCPVNLKNCGYIDSLKNLLCIPLAGACPYNKMMIMKKSEVSPGGESYTEFSFNDIKLLATNVPNNDIIVTFKISDKIPCADPDYINTLQPFYKLDNKYDRRNCADSKMGNSTYDYRYTEVDTYGYIDLLKENGIYDKLIRLPSIVISSVDTKLYSRGYFGIKQSCKAKIQISYSELINYLIFLKRDMDKNYTNTVIIFVCSIVNIVIVIGCVVASLTKLVFFFFARGFKIICDILMLCFTAMIFSSVNSYGNGLFMLQDGCLDSIAGFAVNTFVLTIAKIQTDLLALLILNILVFGFAIFIPVLAYIYARINDNINRERSPVMVQLNESKVYPDTPNAANTDDIYTYNSSSQPTIRDSSSVQKVPLRRLSSEINVYPNPSQFSNLNESSTSDREQDSRMSNENINSTYGYNASQAPPNETLTSSYGYGASQATPNETTSSTYGYNASQAPPNETSNSNYGYNASQAPPNESSNSTNSYGYN